MFSKVVSEMDKFLFHCMIELITNARLNNCYELVFDLVFIEHNGEQFQESEVLLGLH